LNENVAFVWT